MEYRFGLPDSTQPMSRTNALKLITTCARYYPSSENIKQVKVFHLEVV